MSKKLLDMSILTFLEAEYASVRLLNGLKGAIDKGIFPLNTVAELIQARDKIEFYMSRIPNIGAKTANELKQLTNIAALQIRDEPIKLRDWESSEADGASTSKRNVPRDMTFDEAFDSLSDMERTVLNHRFGLDGMPPKTLAEVGLVYGVTRERIRQRESKAISNLARRCRPLLRQSLDTRANEFWARVTEGTNVLRLDDEPEKKMFLTPRENLEITLVFGAFEDWLAQVARKTKAAWIGKGVDMAAVKEATQFVNTSFSEKEGTVQLDHYVVKSGIPKEAFAVALALSRKWEAYCGYVVIRPLSRRVRRAIRTHLLSCWEGRRKPLSLSELRRHYVGSNPHDQCSTRDLSIVMGAAPHLFLNMYEEGWIAIGPRGFLDTNAMGMQPRGPIARNIDLQEKQQETASGRLKTILASQGPMIFEDLRDRFLAMGKYAPGSVGPLLIGSEEFVRLAPGIYGLRAHLTNSDALKKGQELLLEARQCEFYCRARWAGEPRHLYPLWNVESEHAWAVWAKRGGLESTLSALLSVADPAEWVVETDEKNYWGRLKGRLGFFQIEEPITVPLSETKPTLGEFVAGAILAQVRGGVSWISLNRIRGARIDDRHSHTLLALLVAAGIIEPAMHWQEHHRFIQQATQMVQQLVDDLSVSGVRHWTHVALNLLTTSLAGMKEFGWIDRDALSALVDQISFSVPLKVDGESDVASIVKPKSSEEQLSDLVALVRKKKIIATIEAQQPSRAPRKV